MGLYKRGNSRRSGRVRKIHDAAYWDTLRLEMHSATYPLESAYSAERIKENQKSINAFRRKIQKSDRVLSAHRKANPNKNDWVES